MKKVLKQLTAVFTGAIMASALILPIYAAETSLLQKKKEKAQKKKCNRRSVTEEA